MASKLTDVSCTYTGGGIYLCTGKLTDGVWFATDLETYGTYDVPFDDIDEKYNGDYDGHWTDTTDPLPTWADVLTSILDSHARGDSPNMSEDEVERILRRYHPDLSLRVDGVDDDASADEGTPSGSDRLETIASFIEAFEEFLEDRGIDVPNPEKDEAIRDGSDPESISTIYGTDYGDLSERIESLLTRYGVL